MDAACALLDEHGPMTPGLGVSAAAVREAAGVSRSTVYSHWPSVGDLNQALVSYAVADAVGWQRRLLAESVDQPLAAALARAIGPEPGLLARASLGSWPMGHPVRVAAAAWEQTWFEQAGRWLEANAAAGGRTFTVIEPTVAAMALAALIDGHQINAELLAPRTGDGWFRALDLDVPAAAERFVHAITGPLVGSAPEPVEPPVPLGGSGATPAKAAILGAALERLGGPMATDGSRSSRLVDPARLARRLGVTERRVFDAWPTAGDENADLVGALGARHVTLLRTAAEATAWAELNLPHAEPSIDVFTSFLAAYGSAVVTPGRAHLYHCLAAFQDPEVQATYARSLDETMDSARWQAVSLLLTSGLKIRPEGTVERYLAVSRVAMVGARRIVLTRPELAVATVEVAGRVHTVGGLIALLAAVPELTTSDGRPALS